jgi:CHASE2 domain-containing sensor protein
MKRLTKNFVLRIRLAAGLLAVTLAAGLLPFVYVRYTEVRADLEGRPPKVTVIEAWSYDPPFRLRRRLAPEDMLVVLITDKDFQKLEGASGQVDRRHIVTALKRLHAMQPRLLVLDFLLTAASKANTNDNDLAEQLGRFGARAVLAESVQGTHGRPAPMFATSGVTVASADPVETNLTVRLFPQWFAQGTNRYPSLAIAAADRLHLAPLSVGAGPRWLNYYGLHKEDVSGARPMFARLDFADLVSTNEAQVDAISATNLCKIVLIGSGRTDLRGNPVSGGLIPGVEIQATALANLRESGWLRRVHPFLQLIFIIGWGVALALGLDAHRSPLALITAAGATFALVAFSFALPLYACWWWWWVIAPGQTTVALLADLMLPKKCGFFISYKTDDPREVEGARQKCWRGQDAAQWLEGAIRGAGWHAFLAPGLIPAGAQISLKLLRQIRRAPVFVLILTPAAREDLTAQPVPADEKDWPWVRREVAWALRARRRLLILRINTEPIRREDVRQDLAHVADTKAMDKEYSITTRDEVLRDVLRVLYGDRQ